jgi:hypothetical protein
MNDLSHFISGFLLNFVQIGENYFHPVMGCLPS